MKKIINKVLESNIWRKIIAIRDIINSDKFILGTFDKDGVELWYTEFNMEEGEVDAFFIKNSYIY